MTTSSIGTAGDYTTIAAWEAATPVDSATEWRGQLADEAFDEAPVISGSGSTPIVLEAAPGSGFDGTEGSGPVVAHNRIGGFGVFDVQTSDLTLEGFEMVGNSTDQHGIRFISGSSSQSYIFKRLLIHDTGGQSVADTNGSVVTAINCLAYKHGGDNTFGGNSSFINNLKVINCTGMQNLTGADTASSGVRYGIAKNTAMLQYGPTASYRAYLNLAAGSVNYAANDTSGNPASLDSLVATTVLIDPTTTGLDFRPVSGQALDGAGIGNATDSDIPTVDIAGNPRSTTAPTIGAFEVASGGGGTPISISATVDSFSLSSLASAINAQKNLSGAVDAIALAALSASINAEKDVLTNLDSLALSTLASTITHSTGVTASKASLLLSALASSIEIGAVLSTTKDSLSLSPFAATAELSKGVQATLRQLGITPRASAVVVSKAVAAAVESLSLIGLASTTKMSKNIAASTRNLGVGEYVAIINNEEVVGLLNFRRGTYTYIRRR